MSKATFEDAIAPWEMRQRDEQMSATWGHLHPEDQREYTGYLLFCLGDYGNQTIIRSRFGGLDDSPWFFEDMNEFVSQQLSESKAESGSIWRWTGTYKRILTPGREMTDDDYGTEDEWNWEFTGNVREVRVK